MPQPNRFTLLNVNRLSITLIFVLALVTSAFASLNETVIYNFAGGAAGANPYSGLIADASGNLYGTTGVGGSSTHCNLGSGCGTVFMLAPPSYTETVLYSFQGASVNDGSGPQASLIFDKTGALYGTTGGGGQYGQGTAFKLTPPAQQGGAWTETVLYSFAGGTDGSSPAAALIFDGTSLCGTTSAGGASSFGTVFELTPPKKKGGPWTEAILYSFTGRSDGGKPYGSLLLKTKSLYGTTLDGGPSSQGEVFELTPGATKTAPWTLSVLYGFTGNADGGKPYAGVILGKLGVLYGTTGLGGSGTYGTVFQLTPGKNGAPWTESVLYNFGGGPDGAYPRYGVVADTAGNLYGTTGVGSTNSGVVFQLLAPKKGGVWTENVLWSFSGGSDGGDTTAGLLLTKNVLYGTTSLGGQQGKGVAFSVIP
jgi:uncharacterized repeat protein (TIGR03803 family)